MGMSTSIVGLRKPHERWNKMKAVWDACSDAGLAIPGAVMEFFGHVPPDPEALSIDLEGAPCVRPYTDEDSEGFELDIEKLPSDIKIVRFFNSW